MYRRPFSYQERLRRAAFGCAMYRELDIPDRTLGVGPAENLSPYPRQELMVPQSRPGPDVLFSKETQEGYEGFPGRGSLVPPEDSLRGVPDYGPALAGV